jgi:uncharacterized protein YbjQ (UPF0145 family)
VLTLNSLRCENIVPESAGFPPNGGATLTRNSPFMLVTTPTLTGYKIKKVLGIVTGLTPCTSGIFGQFLAGFQSMVGGEATAFTSEGEKTRWEATDRAKPRAIALGSNVIISLDVETSPLELKTPLCVFSSTGTAMVIEPETASSSGSV